MDLEDLYDRLDVPLEWLNLTRLKAELDGAVTKVYERYSIPCSEEILSATYEDLTRGDAVDFGRLSESIQESIIQRVMDDPACRADLSPSTLSLRGWTSLSQKNREIAERDFGLNRYGDLIVECYEFLAGAKGGVPEWIEPLDILEQFLAPETFSFLRS